MNGEVFPNITIEELPLGADTIIEMRNVSSSEHPFHLHGHEFRLFLKWSLPAFRQMEDTINVSLYETVVLRLNANNPRIGWPIVISRRISMAA